MREKFKGRYSVITKESRLDLVRKNIFYVIVIGLAFCFLASSLMTGAFAMYYLVVIGVLVADELAAKTILRILRGKFHSFFESTAFWRLGLLTQGGRIVVSLVIISLLGFKEEFGFNLGNMNESLRLVLLVGLPFAALFAFGAFIFIKKGQSGKLAIPSADWLKNSRDRIGTIIYCFTLNGIGEEILYRGLIQGYLSMNMAGFVLVGSFPLFYSTIVASAIFILVHFYTMEETKSEFLTMLPYRIIITFIIAIAFQLTGSLLAPIIIHGISNGFLVLAAIKATKID
jgi:membrane protease YdiL (CAAX protease family)